MSDEPLTPYLRLDNGTIWPNPVYVSDLEWRLRYATPTRADLRVAASTLHAYWYLTDGAGNKQLPLLRRAVKRLRKSLAVSGE